MHTNKSKNHSHKQTTESGSVQGAVFRNLGEKLLTLTRPSMI